MSKVSYKPITRVGHVEHEPVPAAKRRRGRPNDFEPWMIQRAASLAAEGAIDTEICEELGISERTFYYWQAKYPEFLQAIDAGKTMVNKRVGGKLLSLTMGGTKKTVTTDADGKTTIKVEEVKPDRAAIGMWLFNRDPNRWKNRVEAELVVPIADDMPAMTEEEIDVRKLALSAIALIREAPSAPVIEGETRHAPHQTPAEAGRHAYDRAPADARQERDTGDDQARPRRSRRPQQGTAFDL